MLTPRYTAASRTVSGSSSGATGNPRALPPGKLIWGRCLGFMPICKASSRFSAKVLLVVVKSVPHRSKGGSPMLQDWPLSRADNSFGDRFRDILYVDLMTVWGL